MFDILRHFSHNINNISVFDNLKFDDICEKYFKERNLKPQVHRLGHHYHKRFSRLHKFFFWLLSDLNIEFRNFSSLSSRNAQIRPDAKCYESLNQNSRSRELPCHDRVAVDCSYLRLSVQKLIKWKPRRKFALRGQIKNSSISFRVLNVFAIWKLRTIRVYWIALTKRSANRHSPLTSTLYRLRGAKRKGKWNLKHNNIDWITRNAFLPSISTSMSSATLCSRLSRDSICDVHSEMKRNYLSSVSISICYCSTCAVSCFFSLELFKIDAKSTVFIKLVAMLVERWNLSEERLNIFLSFQ